MRSGIIACRVSWAVDRLELRLLKDVEEGCSWSVSMHNAMSVVFTAARRDVVIIKRISDVSPLFCDGKGKKRCLLLHCNCDFLKSYLDIC